MASNKEHSEDVAPPTNIAFCQQPALYADKGEPTSGAIAQVTQLAAPEVQAPKRSFKSICKSLIAGGVAGGVSRTAVAPLERLKILLQVQNHPNPKYSGMAQGLKYIWTSERFVGLFKGNGANCARIIPNSAVKFYSYEQASSNGSCTFSSFQYSASEDAELTPLLRLGSGACAGIIAMSATYPMDMMRGRLTVQTQDSPRRYKGMFHAASTIAKEEGPRALYKGWVPSVVGVIPYAGLNFGVYESLKDWISKMNTNIPGETADLSIWTRLGCGAAAGMAGQTMAYPFDVIRRRLQMVGWKDAAAVITADGQVKAPAQYKGMVDCLKRTVANEGVGGLYKGLLPNSIKVVPSIALAFVTYEVMKDLLKVDFRIPE